MYRNRNTWRTKTRPAKYKLHRIEYMLNCFDWVLVEIYAYLDHVFYHSSCSRSSPELDPATLPLLSFHSYPDD